MRLLLDTHAVLWALTDSPRLSRRAAALIGDAANDLLISPVTAYEVCLKHTLGKLPEAAALAADFEGELLPLNIEWLPITQVHMIAAGKLDMTHRDPFDRILMGQSLVERVPLVDRGGVRWLWGGALVVNRCASARQQGKRSSLTLPRRVTPKQAAVSIDGEILAATPKSIAVRRPVTGCETREDGP